MKCKVSFDYFIGQIGVSIFGSLVSLSMSILADGKYWYLNSITIVSLLFCSYYIWLVTNNKSIFIIDETGVTNTPLFPPFAKPVQIPWHTIVAYDKYTEDTGEGSYCVYLRIITIKNKEKKINLSRLENDNDDIIGVMKFFSAKNISSKS